MISRYSRPEMAALWTPEARFEKMLQVELAVADVQGRHGLIPKDAAKQLRAKAKINTAKIEEIEKTTRHDVIAFVSQVAATVGDAGRYLHFGLTSSDVLDTALSLQVRAAADVLKAGLDRWQKALSQQMKKHEATMCAGRTHGMHAEVTSFGVKLAGFLTELKRSRARFERAVEQMQVGKLSGAVGTFASLSPEIEADVCAFLKLRPEPVATQVLPRDRHAELIWSMAMLGSALERLAVELRHLQRTEVAEVREGFKKGQKGSSAMPHKRNPISAENLTGAARLLRSYVHPALENIALWHERDISHSAVERVIFADAFILLDFAAHRMAELLDGLEVFAEVMTDNMERSSGQLFSSQLLLALINKGQSREDAYALVQELSHKLKDGEQLEAKASADKRVLKLLKRNEIAQVFSGHSQRSRFKELLSRADKTPQGGWL